MGSHLSNENCFVGSGMSTPLVAEWQQVPTAQADYSDSSQALLYSSPTVPWGHDYCVLSHAIADGWLSVDFSPWVVSALFWKDSSVADTVSPLAGASPHCAVMFREHRLSLVCFQGLLSAFVPPHF